MQDIDLMAFRNLLLFLLPIVALLLFYTRN